MASVTPSDVKAGRTLFIHSTKKEENKIYIPLSPAFIISFCIKFPSLLSMGKNLAGIHEVTVSSMGWNCVKANFNNVLS